VDTPDRDLDEHLETILVGGLEARTVEIVDSDPAWARRYQREKARLVHALDGVFVRIEHIGSTAVPGLAAKPVVDILVTVADVEDEVGYRTMIEQLGYELRVKEPDHRAFRTRERDVNLHVYKDNDPEVDRYLLFRDRLREHPQERALYERVKRDLAQREWPDINYYADAKSEVVEGIIERARRARDRGAQG
jgi:GrpB-like predicted nucleotidyltransferase (UPF0157 family)